MDTHYNIHARACGCAYRCVDGEEKRERMGKEWAGMGKEADYGSGKKHQDLF